MTRSISFDSTPSSADGELEAGPFKTAFHDRRAILGLGWPLDGY